MATIQEVYIALFGRPADPAGLEYYVDVTNDGANLDAVGDLSASEEYTDRFEGFNNNQKVTQIYLDLFNRTPDAAGLAFYVNLLNTGAATEQDIAIRILDGATGDDRDIIDNKVEAANAFTASIDTATEIGAYVGDDAAEAGRAFLAGITSDPATIPDQAAIDQAVKDIEDGVGTGTTFTLNGGAAETVDGTAGGDVFNAANVGDLITGDVINGGQSVDTLNATLDGTNVAPTLNSVENLFLTSAGGAYAIDLENATGVQQVWAVDQAAADTLTVDNAKAGITFGVQNAVAGTGYVINFADDELDDDATLRLALDDTDGTAVAFTSGDDADIDAIQISLMGDEGNADLTGLTNAEEVNVTGSGDATISLGAGVEDFDSTGVDGDVTLNVGAADVTAELGDGDNVVNGGSGDIEVTGGDGEDTLVAGSGDSVLDGGDGNDVLGGGTGSAELTGGAGEDEFHFNGGMSGNAVIDFDINEDVISFLKDANVSFGGSFDDGINGNSDIGADDYVELGGFGDFVAGDHEGGVVVFNGAFANDAAIESAANGADLSTDGIYFVAYNTEEGVGQIWYDAIAGDATDPVLLGTIDTLDSLSDVQALGIANFDIY